MIYKGVCDLGNIKNLIEEKEISRRSFIKGLTAITAVSLLEGCSNQLVEFSNNEENILKAEDLVWKNAPCWHNCGGKCILKAGVKDGVITRLKTDDSHEDTYDYPQIRACVRGLSQKVQIIGKERLKYPMKRTHFDPEGKTGKDLRGRDTWERISWDEALDILADQLQKAKKNYGNESIYLINGGEMQRTMSLFGGYVKKYGSRSRGAWKQGMEPILGINQKRHALNDRYELLNSKLIILWGCNPAQNAMGMPYMNLRRAKEKGVKIISIDPMYSRTAAVLADDYFPIRPATDTPLILAICYLILKEDEKKDHKVIDWDFLDKCVQGFDEKTMPEGSDKKENFKDYVLGTYDNLPKTPEWASKICGLEVKRIEELANLLMENHPTTALFGWNSARVEKAQHVCLAQTALGAMTGNIGVKGGCFAVSAQECSTNGGPALVKMGKDGIEEIKNPIKKPKLCTTEHWEDILSNTYTDGDKGKKPLDIHVIYHSHCASLNQSNNTNKGIKAHRKVDFVVTNHFTFTPEAQFSDLVLPVTTPWEKEGEVLQENRELLIWSQKVMDPYFESKDDAWIARELAKRLGLDPEKADPISNAQRCFNIIASSKVVKEDGKTFENLVSITNEDLKKLNVEGKPQEGRVPILQLQKDGKYQVKRSPDDKLGYIHNKKFRDDPVKNKLKTESGKIEIYSPALKKKVDKAGWNEGYAYAKYVPATEGYEATFSDFEKGVKGKYPYQVLTVHDLRGTHTVFNQVDWLREAFEYDVVMNPKDANDKGFKQGDTIRIYNDRGSVLRTLKLSERVMPGVVVIHEGAWVNIEGEDCIAGSPNVLSGDFPSGPDVESWGAIIANVEKVSKDLKKDWEVDLGVKL
ncbi:molybdopterin-dependent oxidoreductase [Finegoldia magna]|uniref:molybdopterin-dependent oxidoreductase n=1 Tax=Finegoldia magna TaxID=1260 RepID=UPI001D13CE4B|nr:molybdopterin-dependent oxidoreductase [Finegoldia magna]UEB34046.1 molybdopterin-dependent oxidoreductase [Finegoldia magna]